MKTILILLTIATSALSQGLYFGSSVPAAIGPTNWVTGGVPTGSFQNPGAVVVGCQFTANANLTVKALAFWVHANTEDDIPIGLYKDDGTLLRSVTLHLANYSDGTMGYTNVADVALTSGSTYRIAGFPKSLTLFGGYYDDTGAAPTLLTDATLNNSCYVANAGLAFPSTINTAGKMYGPISFTYTKP